ncbi:hypothetical protein EXS71_03620 [Candidatus Uhrbacteria bacterium]|nr:hypothetical protein [Candidatus Uhrbacteria bacterium]
MKRYYFLVGGAMISLIFLGVGCNPVAKIQEKVAEKAVEGLINKSTGGKASVDIGDNKMTFTNNKTGESMAYGENLTIPESFPRDVPIYPGAKAVAIVTAKEGSQSASLNLVSTDEAAKVTAWYADQMKQGGWTEASSMTVTGADIRTYEKGKVKLAVTIIGSTDENEKNKESSISLVRTEEK